MGIMKPKKSRSHYINNQELSKALGDYAAECAKAKEEGKAEPPVPNYIGQAFMLIATNYSMVPMFNNYSYKDEMIMDAVENCLLYFRNFDSSRGTSALSYFTRIAYHAFLRRIAKEHKLTYTKYKYAEEMGLLFSSDNGDDVSNPNRSENHQKQWETYDNIATYIRNYEQREANKKEKKRIKDLSTDPVSTKQKL